MTVEGPGFENLCSSDIAFLGDVRIPVVLVAAAENDLELVRILEPRSRDFEMSLTATGGILCDALTAFEERFFGAVVGLLEDIAARRIEALNAELAGKKICTE